MTVGGRVELGPVKTSSSRRTVKLPCFLVDELAQHLASHPNVIQARFGHSSIRTTLDTYGHLFDGLDEAAADRLDASYQEALANFTRTIAGSTS